MENQRTRSPRYPSISLRDAVDLARKIYSKDGMHPLDRESAVKHLGYTSLNGASATALASLKQYGLTADAGTGMLRLTELALDIIEPTSEDTQHSALQVAAYSPDLFAALRERFPEKPPSESNLRAHLVRQGFTPAAVKSIIPSYLETHEYITSIGEIGKDRAAVEPSEHTPSDRQPESLQSKGNPYSVSGTPQVPSTLQAHTVPVGTRRMVFDTEEGEAIFTYPDALSDASIDDLEAWLALVVKRLRRTGKQ